MIHMTHTYGWGAVWGVSCRCGWWSEGFATRTRARLHGDQHLAQANA